MATVVPGVKDVMKRPGMPMMNVISGEGHDHDHDHALDHHVDTDTALEKELLKIMGRNGDVLDRWTSVRK
jgi:hypothetical protein